MNFENPEQTAEKHEINEKIAGYKEILNKLLKEEADGLRKLGIGVDDECRIKISEFKKLFGEEKIEKDLKKIEEKELKFEKKAQKGEMLEMAKTLAFNNKWFNGKLIAIRTSKYDDYFNGVDQLIFDQETKTPLAAVDTTTNWKDKAGELQEKIKNGARVKYGLDFKNDLWKKKSYRDLPFFIISVNEEELLTVLEDIEKGKLGDKSTGVEKRVLKELKLESEEFRESASPKLKQSYKQAADIFGKL